MAYKSWQAILRISLEWTIVIGCIFALLQGIGSLSHLSIILFVIFGGLAASIAVFEHGWYRAPIPIGTPIRFVVILAFIWSIMTGMGCLAWPRTQRQLTLISPCAIVTNSQPLEANPTPDHASDKQLASESLVVDENIENLVDISLMSYANNHHQTQEQAQEITCKILQAYESNLRVPAMAIRGAILERIPLDDRIASQTLKIKAAYQNPTDTRNLLDVVQDLLRIATRLAKIKGFEPEWPNNRWILPIEHPVPPAWIPDLRDSPVQHFAAQKITVELRVTRVYIGSNFDYTVTAKSTSPNLVGRRIRILFANPIHSSFWLGRQLGDATIGANFIDINVGQSCELQTLNRLVITGVREQSP